ncbi:hypothetical protein SAMD00019534_063180 [Acytostelium subglobosum LB1]|uniref:hypothetical protein n=1 Tax=Acytostelium subglobosum LB1 TaxID=1410327 RepID=UPI000644F8F1|nr:hypothetical protein SAMD00019534_063180 [Acytostelium subglobosum LB1]GAM23143.1 hypothetical protein SAMD00019534_063180 [Acytostelium subglobosum LB1]|eukprot:XP_012753592.1 hypothetical protein SAMD00019534_063180 [Acytostelium subglobosum LB1]
MLSWAFIQYESNIQACGLTQLYLDDLKWGMDWLIACHVSDNVMVGQVGSGYQDHSWWGPPELNTMKRQVYYLNTSSPGTEVAMEASAALSAASIIWKSRDPTYSSLLLSHAKSLHTFGDTYRGIYTKSIPDAQSFYDSYSGFNDEIVWGTIWLYKASGDPALLTKAKSDYVTFGIGAMGKGNSHDWDLKAPGVSLLMSQVIGGTPYTADTEGFLNYWLPGGGVPYTPGGLAWIRQWGPCRYSATAAFLASVYGGVKYTTFTQAQIKYMLGDNPNQQSFVVGIGSKHPINPHHSAAHHSLTDSMNDPINNVYLIKGALVGGPSLNDSYLDDRADYIRNEVALDYNAGFCWCTCIHG